jgi:hypothetical protein
MTQHQWRIVAEVIQEAQSACEQSLMERLALAVHELNVPASVLDRMQQTVTTAVARAFRDDSTRAASVRILTRVLQSSGESSVRSWGFFLVERGTSDREPYQIEAFVYLDGS